MVVETFEISFDRVSKTFYSGEKVLGQVLVHVEREHEVIEALGLRLWGKATVTWLDSSSSSKPKRKTSRSSTSTTDLTLKPPDDNLILEEETYFDRRVNIVEKTGPENVTISIGKNVFPFEISLPSGIPSSFEGEHGQVNYYLEAVIKRGVGVNNDLECKIPLYVIGILDLNTSHEALVERPEVASEKSICCMCCKSGPIGFHFRVLGKSGMMPGEKIPFSAEAFNMSYAGAVTLTLRFVQVITYSTKDRKKEIKKEFFKMKGPCISRGGTGLWNSDFIELPQDLPPTRLAGRSEIINVEYCLDVVLEIPRVSNLSAQIPVVIGTIPFGSSVDSVITQFDE